MQKDFISPVKSVGHGITCTADLDNEEEVFHVLLELSQDVGHRLRVHGLAATGVQIFVRNKSLYSTQYQYKLPFKTQPQQASSYSKSVIYGLKKFAQSPFAQST